MVIITNKVNQVLYRLNPGRGWPEYVNKLLDNHPAETYHIYVYANNGNWLYSMTVRRKNAHEIVYSGRIRRYAQYT